VTSIHVALTTPDHASLEINTTAAIPLSASFYGNGFDLRVVRVCFAKKEETLHAALGRLAKL